MCNQFWNVKTMREDLNKVLCEHERARSWDKYGNYRNLKKFDDRTQDDHDDEEASKDMIGSGSRESMKHRYGYDQRQFGEHLNPLYGFVRKSVGHKWDEVYSEICQTFDKRSVINQHILVHLFQYVEKNTRIGVDGGVYFLNEYVWGANRGWQPIEKSGSEYYVHPVTNILTKVDLETLRQENAHLREQRAAELAKIKRVISDTIELHKIKGVWYEVTFADNEPEKVLKEVTPYGGKKHTYFDIRYVTHYKYDVLKKCSTTERRYAESKRQLNHKEIKKHGLS